MWWTHSEARGCGDVGGVESVQSSSAAHVQQPGLLLQQQGAVVLGRANETGAAQQTCGDRGHLDLKHRNGSKCMSLSLKRRAATRGWFLERRLRRRGGGTGRKKYWGIQREPCPSNAKSHQQLCHRDVAPVSESNFRCSAAPCLICDLFHPQWRQTLFIGHGATWLSWCAELNI